MEPQRADSSTGDVKEEEEEGEEEEQYAEEFEGEAGEVPLNNAGVDVEPVAPEAGRPEFPAGPREASDAQPVAPPTVLFSPASHLALTALPPTLILPLGDRPPGGSPAPTTEAPATVPTIILSPTAVGLLQLGLHHPPPPSQDSVSLDFSGDETAFTEQPPSSCLSSPTAADPATLHPPPPAEHEAAVSVATTAAMGPEPAGNSPTTEPDTDHPTGAFVSTQELVIPSEPPPTLGLPVDDTALRDGTPVGSDFGGTNLTLLSRGEADEELCRISSAHLTDDHDPEVEAVPPEAPDLPEPSPTPEASQPPQPSEPTEPPQPPENLPSPPPPPADPPPTLPLPAAPDSLGKKKKRVGFAAVVQTLPLDDSQRQAGRPPDTPGPVLSDLPDFSTLAAGLPASSEAVDRREEEEEEAHPASVAKASPRGGGWERKGPAEEEEKEGGREEGEVGAAPLQTVLAVGVAAEEEPALQTTALVQSVRPAPPHRKLSEPPTGSRQTTPAEVRKGRQARPRVPEDRRQRASAPARKEDPPRALEAEQAKAREKRPRLPIPVASSGSRAEAAEERDATPDLAAQAYGAPPNDALRTRRRLDVPALAWQQSPFRPARAPDGKPAAPLNDDAEVPTTPSPVAAKSQRPAPRPPLPENPTQVKVEGIQPTQADVKWSRAEPAVPDTRVQYRVLLSDDAGQHWDRVGLTERRVWRLSGLLPNTQYHVSVVTVVGKVEGPGGAPLSRRRKVIHFVTHPPLNVDEVLKPRTSSPPPFSTQLPPIALPGRSSSHGDLTLRPPKGKPLPAVSDPRLPRLGGRPNLVGTALAPTLRLSEAPGRRREDPPEPLQVLPLEPEEEVFAQDGDPHARHASRLELLKRLCGTQAPLRAPLPRGWLSAVLEPYAWLAGAVGSAVGLIGIFGVAAVPDWCLAERMLGGERRRVESEMRCTGCW